MSAQEELHQIVRQLKTELEWVLRVGAETTAADEMADDIVDDTACDPGVDAGHAADHTLGIVATDPVYDQARSATAPGAGRGRNAVAQAADEFIDRAGDVNPGLLTLDNAGSLSQIREVLGDCTRCKLHGLGRTKIVFGVGNPKAALMFVGEGPGGDEDRVGEPFVGAAGQLLTRIIEQGMKIPRSEVYIANIVKCRPPRNRDPEPDEVDACEPFLRAQIRAINPRIVVALGRYAAQTLLRTSTPITRLRGVWADYCGIPVMPTYHPAYLLRNPAEKRAVWNDVQTVVARLAEEPRD